MADFDPPFASTGGVNRSPTTDEQSDGFQCGAADLTLFNRLFGRIEAEMKAIQDAGGIAGTESDDTTVLQAIEALISAATGGGDTSNFVLFSQAQARLPIFPEAQTSDGTITVTAPSTGTVRVPAGVTVIHRGIRTYVSAQTDFATAASKTYHLRWSPTGSFVLKDLADITYNPTTAAETNTAFDSGYDDMLVARVITNSSNIATITNLKNKARLAQTGEELQAFTTYQDELPPSGLTAPDGAIVNVNFARKPIAYLTGFTDVTVQQGNDTATKEVNIVVQSLSRYQVKAIYQRATDPGGGYVGWAASA
ncbi:hypothetical protein EHI47_11770 [Rhizobium leguminosarum]|uniref:Uncharacterized protein n=1 Tax=Rhizobium leguminosarum TaxID=384 RepID=A0A444I396_RHILE|nr:hypothetical protein [Rhizobium leguminosarum]RWX32053.1 hypothetical protein EHI47_11770 [Rhizobium leguminosarum]